MAIARTDSTWAQDMAGGCAVAVVGVGAVLIGRTYGIGTLRQMAPGFFPVALGCLLGVLGLAMVGAALHRRRREGGDDRDATLVDMPDWRGCGFIVLGVGAFLFIGRHGGLAPAAFACVFLSALGDRTMSWRRALVFGLAVAVLGTLLFSVLLGIQMPIVAGWPS